ncbi:TetR family transcriptional regulator [Pseudobdellovibrio exovorus]|uniref:HTH tetR-type domain-containing protein n=1 Tax=Pseudobdellovibrio exovorus JSS TaxID=1184267 RepID=M4VS01_9BACT|nr:TetR family transcriptional regulator [Pseudobdellovibrio exovorus]AGH95959.1 hypothetical protein A11Q_1743 [Pseudobdellovibrio exovorus JSS]
MSAADLKKKILKPTKREALKCAALKLFSEKGFHAVSTKELSEKAKANISLISFYFGSKKGLLQNLFEELSQHQIFDTDRLFSGPINSREELEQKTYNFLKELTDFFSQHHELLILFFCELELESQEAQDLFPKTFVGLYQSFMAFLEKAKSQGLISAETDIEILSLRTISPISSLLRSFKSSKQHFHISLKNPEFREKLIATIAKDVAYKN